MKTVEQVHQSTEYKELYESLQAMSKEQLITHLNAIWKQQRRGGLPPQTKHNKSSLRAMILYAYAKEQREQ